MPKTNESQNESQNPGTFVMLPVELLLSDRCSPVALKLYAVLLMYCREGNTAWPGEPRLAENMHISQRHVRTVLAELIECGLIQKEVRPGTSNMYHVEKYQLLGATEEPAGRTPPSAPLRNAESHEVHAPESNKKDKADRFDSYVKSVGDIHPATRWKLIKELGQNATDQLLAKSKRYGLDPRRLDEMCRQAHKVPAGQKHAYIGNLMEQAIRNERSLSL